MKTLMRRWLVLLPKLGMGTSASELGARILGILEGLDKLRVKSGRLQGQISGRMRDMFQGIKEITEMLVTKAEGNTVSTELNKSISQCNRLKEENTRLRAEFAMMKLSLESPKPARVASNVGGTEVMAPPATPVTKVSVGEVRAKPVIRESVRVNDETIAQKVINELRRSGIIKSQGRRRMGSKGWDWKEGEGRGWRCRLIGSRHLSLEGGRDG